MDRKYYVSVNGSDKNPGTQESPFRTISKAAQIARSGDTVIVGGGTYREWVDPMRGGDTNNFRITYQAADGEKPVIKGSEVIKDWEALEKGVWKVEIDNTFFGDFNPYDDYIYGDWLYRPGNYILHTGDVYLNGKSFYEAYTLEEVFDPQIRTEGACVDWNEKKELIPDPECTLRRWFARVDDEKTTIWANFGDADPNTELVEINVRKACFYPNRRGRNYITLKGFEIAQAACPFAPPTGDQIGMIGAHWSKGWIIEDCILHDAKACAISIGTDWVTGENPFVTTHKKPGYQYQNETVCYAAQNGWNKELVGSHIIRNNLIYDCGQNGIVGNLGCIYCEIYGNEIYHIATKHEFFGFDMAAIKFHAAIDTTIRNNYLHDNTLGVWLDWQAQGTRLSSNLSIGNDRDLMIEVTHGPCIVDNNIFASEYTLEDTAQGTAFIHNLFGGGIKHTVVPDRSTPYHFEHSTQVKGTSFVYSGDDRYYQNIFLGSDTCIRENFRTGTDYFDGCPVSMEEYTKNIVDSIRGDDDENLYIMNRQAVYINGNIYLGGAGAFEREENNVCAQDTGSFSYEQTEDEVWLNLTLPAESAALKTKIYETKDLGLARACDCSYENPDGSPITFDIDLKGIRRDKTPMAGPLAEMKAGENRILVWKRG